MQSPAQKELPGKSEWEEEIPFFSVGHSETGKIQTNVENVFINKRWRRHDDWERQKDAESMEQKKVKNCPANEELRREKGSQGKTG